MIEGSCCSFLCCHVSSSETTSPDIMSYQEPAAVDTVTVLIARKGDSNAAVEAVAKDEPSTIHDEPV